MYKVKSNHELKDVDGTKGLLTAYVSIFGNVDSDRDMMMPGAFKKTILERGPVSSKNRIKHLFQHSPWDVIGIPLEMEEDSKGLLVRSKFGSDQFSKDKLQQHLDGLITEFSIGYNVIKEENKINSPTGEDDYNMLQEVKLWEYSSVTWGANELTYVVDAKGNHATVVENINDRMNKLVKALRNGNYTDETCESFEIELKQIQTIYNEIIKGIEPSNDTRHAPSDDTLTDEQIGELIKLLK